MTRQRQAHDDASAGFDALVQTATADPDVVGLVLTGSMAAGIPSPWSDYDVRLVLRDDVDDAAIDRYASADFPNVDLGVMTLRDFAGSAAWGSAFAWDRYAFFNARVVLDRTGTLQGLVDAIGRIPPEHQESYTAQVLDAFINSVYRTLKCQRRGNDLCVRLEAAEAVHNALHAIFAFEGRLKPYPNRLAHDLRISPLAAFPIPGDALLQILAAILKDGDVAALQRLFVTVMEQARDRGYGEAVDDWGEAMVWMLGFSPGPLPDF
jgi:hypothetical protein